MQTTQLKDEKSSSFMQASLLLFFKCLYYLTIYNLIKLHQGSVWACSARILPLI